MRPLLVSQRFPPDGLGGVERYTETLARELMRGGDAVSILTRRTEAGRTKVHLIRERLPDGVAVYRIGAGNFGIEDFLQDHERLERLFSLALIESSADVVHINHLMGLSPRFIHIAHRLGVPVVLSLHDFYFACPRVHLQTPSGNLCSGPDAGRACARICFANGTLEGDRLRWGLRNLYFNRALAMADEVVAYSAFVKDYFQPLRLPGRPIHVVPNGTACGSPAIGARERKAGQKLTVAFCGTVAPHKGAHVILEALRTAGLSVEFRLFGHLADPHYRRRLEEKSAAIPGLRLRLYGKYEPTDLGVLLSDVDLVIVPSLVPEAGPIAPREALSQGVPVVVSRLGALPELIVEGENGFTFDPTKPPELAAILQRVAADPELRKRLRAGARKFPVTTAATHAGAIRRIYTEAIASRERTADGGTSTSARFAHRASGAELDFLHDQLLELGCESRPSQKVFTGRS
jgi:glycosyltransferase involved in cell wall biosynthesis